MDPWACAGGGTGLTLTFAQPGSQRDASQLIGAELACRAQIAGTRDSIRSREQSNRRTRKVAVSRRHTSQARIEVRHRTDQRVKRAEMLVRAEMEAELELVRHDTDARIRTLEVSSATFQSEAYRTVCQATAAAKTHADSLVSRAMTECDARVRKLEVSADAAAVRARRATLDLERQEELVVSTARHIWRARLQRACFVHWLIETANEGASVQPHWQPMSRSKQLSLWHEHVARWFHQQRTHAKVGKCFAGWNALWIEQAELSLARLRTVVKLQRHQVSNRAVGSIMVNVHPRIRVRSDCAELCIVSLA
jgi:hypothetical protein